MAQLYPGTQHLGTEDTHAQIAKSSWVLNQKESQTFNTTRIHSKLQIKKIKKTKNKKQKTKNKKQKNKKKPNTNTHTHTNYTRKK